MEADFKGRGKWYSGKVTRVRSDDTFDITFDDGDSEKRVELKRIKVLGGGSRSRSRSRSRSPKRSTKIREGDKCEAEFKSTGKFYPGTVKRVHGDDTCDIVFDDGDKQSYVEASRIKVKGGGRSRSRSRFRSRSPSRGRMRVGTRVEARYRY